MKPGKKMYMRWKDAKKKKGKGQEQGSKKKGGGIGEDDMKAGEDDMKAGEGGTKEILGRKLIRLKLGEMEREIVDLSRKEFELINNQHHSITSNRTEEAKRLKLLVFCV